MNKKVDTLLVNPLLTMRSKQGQKGTQEKSVIEEKGEYMYPYSLVFLSNYLLINGYSSKIIDLYMEPKENLFKYVEENDPNIIGYTGVTPNRFDVIDLINEVHEISNNSLVVVGGRHFSQIAKQTLENNPNIDVVVIGEGEITLLELVKAVDNGYSLEGVLGIAHKNGINEYRPVEKDIDKFTIRSENYPSGYSSLLTMRNYEREDIKSIPIMCGRGCTGSCIYCNHRFIKYRMRTIDLIMEEIEYNIKIHNCKYFSFNDPSIYCDRNWMRKFCNELIDRNLNIKWYCEGRADISLDLLDLMGFAGCISLDFGIETGSKRISKIIKKNIDLDFIIPFVKRAYELGIRSKAFFMVSLPDETEEDALMTLNLARKMSKYLYRVGCGVTLIYPGTELEKIAINKGLFPENFDWDDRNYKNLFPELLASYAYIPTYKEYLSSDFVSNILEQFGVLNVKIAINNKDFWRLTTDVYKRSSKKEFFRRSIRMLHNFVKS